MSNIKTEAIVLKSFKYGESSRIVTIFSDELGKFSAVVKGVRNSRSKIGGVFEAMNHVHVIFNKKDNRDLQYVNSADCISSFPKIKENFDKLMTAFKLSELTNRMMYNYDAGKDVFQILKKVLYTLEKAVDKYDILFIMYQVKFAVAQGINPVPDERNFQDDNFVLNDKDYRFSRNLFTGKEMASAVDSLLSTGFEDYAEVELDEKMAKKIQNAYDYHYMSVAEKYGQSRNRQIIDELIKS